jgi:tetratricopeptide (TPR) repeat protein
MEQRSLFDRAATAGYEDIPGILAELDEVLARDPRSAAFWHAKGVLLVQLDRREEALAAFERAVQLAPNHAGLALGRADTLLQAGLPSVDAYAAAMRAGPGNPGAILGLTEALLFEGRTAEAIAGLDALTAKTPDWTPGLEQLSRIRWMEGDRDDFASAFDRAAAANPTNLEIRRAHLIALVHAGQYDKVEAVVADARRHIGNEVLFDAHEAIVASERGDLQRAEQLFAALGETGDTSITIWHMRLMLRLGRPEVVAAMFERYADHPDRDLVIPYVSIALRMTGDPCWAWLEGDERLVGVYDLADQLPPLDELAAHLRTLHRVRGQQLEQSVRGGTQTHGDLLLQIHPLIRRTAEVIKQAVADYVAQLPPVDPMHPLLSAPRGRPVRFVGSWSVRLTSGGHHANHIHPMGWLSSAMYISLPASANYGGKQGWLTLGQPQAELGLDLPPVRLVEPRPGRLVLFPSTMWHGTVPFGGEGQERLTIAFDVAHPQ